MLRLCEAPTSRRPAKSKPHADEHGSDLGLGIPRGSASIPGKEVVLFCSCLGDEIEVLPRKVKSDCNLRFDLHWLVVEVIRSIAPLLDGI